MPRAFTIIELIIVIAVMLILAGAALNATGGVLPNLRLNNSFNKMILMVQQARSLAFTGKNPAMKSYQITFPIAGLNPDYPYNATLSSTNANDVEQSPMDSLVLTATSNLQFIANANCTRVIIRFINRTGATKLVCEGGTSSPNMQIGIRDTLLGKQKNFSIHQATGIPQIVP